jgi:hypothetical protein
MYFTPDCYIPISLMTKRFRVIDTHLEIWVKEGVLPAPVWMNGRRHWHSNQINQLIAGCLVNQTPVLALNKRVRFSGVAGSATLLSALIIGLSALV